MDRYITLAVIVLAACSSDQPPASTTKAKVRVTGIPDENPTELQRRHAPLVAHLATALDADVTFVPVTDYGAAVQALAAGKVDFAWLGGFTHVQSRRLAKAIPLVMRDIDRDFKSVFIAHKDAAIASPADLRGKRFAFGSKSSTSGHLMPRHFLSTTHKLDAAKDFAAPPVFSGAHDATAKIVESGKVDAGALNKQVWDRMVKDGAVDTNKVDVIWTTPGYVDYVWTARHDVSADLRKAFVDAMLTLDPDNADHKTVLSLQGGHRYVPASPSDFDAIEAVGLSTGLLK